MWAGVWLLVSVRTEILPIRSKVVEVSMGRLGAVVEADGTPREQGNPRRNWARSTLLCLVVLAVGCERPDSSKQVVAWSPASLGSQSVLGDVGVDCTAGGAASCRSEVCLHVSEFPQRGYFCSTYCRSQDNCPVGWPCGPTPAGISERVCVPPGDANGQRAIVPNPLNLPPRPAPPQLEPFDGGAP